MKTVKERNLHAIDNCQFHKIFCIKFVCTILNKTIVKFIFLSQSTIRPNLIKLELQQKLYNTIRLETLLNNVAAEEIARNYYNKNFAPLQTF